MRCVQVDASGFVVDVAPQPVDVATCALVLTSGAEVVGSPFALTIEQANSLLVAILGVWALGWVFRQLSRQLREG
ncbi:MAG: hypothetical protein [Inoviridae sp. ctBZ32]|nr:MAG: hypothetical protein [Inoviridae sp. ctBZ32]